MVKNLDDIYITYENNGKYFKDYKSAYYNSKHCSCKRVNYVFTPTETLCKNVGELLTTARKYFANFDCDYVDIVNKKCIEQIKLF